MCEQDCIHTIESSISRKPRLGRNQFFGNSWPEYDRARQIFPLHDFFYGQCSGDIHRLSGVMSLAMTRRSLDHWLAIGNTGHL